MPELDAADIAVALTKLEGRTESLESQLRQIDRTVGELLGMAATAGAGLTGLLGPLLRKFGL